MRTIYPTYGIEYSALTSIATITSYQTA